MRFRREIFVLVSALFTVTFGIVGCDAPMWRAAWPKPKPVAAKSCDPQTVGPEVRRLVLEAELDYDDGHVKRTMLVNRAAPKNTPDTPDLAKVGECYSDAVDLQPHAKGKVVVEYKKAERGADVCLIRSAIQDGAFVGCVMRAIGSIPPSWFEAGRETSVVSIDFQPETEAAYREWYGTGEMRWDGNQAPRMTDVPKSD